MAEEVLLRLIDVSKAFPGVQALDKVCFELKPGEVHCLLGENGAGKSTLIKILSGAYHKDSGSIIMNGQEVEIKNAHFSRKLGISTIYQEMSLIPGMSVAENIFLGEEITHGGLALVDKAAMEQRAQEIFAEMNVAISPRSLIKELSTAQQQMVEIARSLVNKRQIIIMDECTSSISEKDAQELFRIVRKLKAQGVAIIYISHRLQELVEIVDRVTVLRDGRYIGTVAIKDASIDSLINMMVGRELSKADKPVDVSTKQRVLEIEGLKRGNWVEQATFHLHKGEILGFAGLVGSGRTELMRLIFGADKADAGVIKVNGYEVKIKSPIDAIKNGIGYLSEDRKHEGLIIGMGIDKNITLANLSRVCKGLILNKKLENQTALEKINELSVVTSSADKIAKYLSGGNQQKVVIAKWLLTDCDILIFDEPTRGIDVGARAEIYSLMHSLVQAGKSIIVVSSDFAELLRICNRIEVMYQGQILGEFANDGELTQEMVMPIMLGGIGNAS